jgi:signal transduction histidine kinase/ligand-binding sensor domain-containing protein
VDKRERNLFEPHIRCRIRPVSRKIVRPSRIYFAQFFSSIGAMRPRTFVIAKVSAQLLRWFALLYIVALIPIPASGLNPNLKSSQYGHTVWRLQDGVLPSMPNAIAQTTDGYIWIGTESGLIRFDGARFVPFQPPTGENLRFPAINSLLGDADGSLWIGTGAGLAHWKNGHLTSFLTGIGRINSIIQTNDGGIWVARSRPFESEGALCHVEGSKLRCFGTTEGIPFTSASPLIEGNAGSLWIANASELVHWNHKESTIFAPPQLAVKAGLGGYAALISESDGTLWAGMLKAGQGLGLQHLKEGVWKPFVSSDFDSSKLAVTALLLDRDGALWIGTRDQGVYKIHGHRVDHYRSADGLSSDSVNNFYEDREGEIWVVTSRGMDKFRDLAVISYSTGEGLSGDDASAVATSRDGKTWVANFGALDLIQGDQVSLADKQRKLPGRQLTALLADDRAHLWVGIDNGLSVFANGKFTPFGKGLGPFQDIVQDSDGTVWASTFLASAKLFHLSDSNLLADIQLPSGRHIRSMAANPDGGILAAFDDGDLGLYRNGKWQTFPLHRATNNWKVNQTVRTPDKAMMFATNVGVTGWREQKLQDLGVENGLPCPRVYSMVFDSKKGLWLYTQCGVVSIPEEELNRWWAHADAKLAVRVFDVFDGAQPAVPNFSPRAAMSTDGKLWFVNGSIVQQIDPMHLPINAVLPSVHVEEVIADQKRYTTENGLRLPALTREVEINYTATSLKVPQKVRFRYKLEGFENEWQNANTRRQAFYTNLPPGRYRFRAIACNNDGFWNETGAALEFSVVPAYYQTRWFQTVCAAAFGGLLWLFYLMRLRRATVQIQERLGAKIEERERIARELHDTLLQSVQGLLLRFQAEMYGLPEREPTRQRLEQVLDRADEVLVEGRERVRDLRAEATTGNDLAEALRHCAKELAQDYPIAFNLFIVGTAQILDPTVYNEVCQIAREAITNAFQHSKATLIETVITYDQASLRVMVRDDGRGIEEEILVRGLAGHWGLSGMRERGKKIGVKLNILSHPGSGTEIDLVVPARLAYRRGPNVSLWKKIRQMIGKFGGQSPP